MSLLLIVALCSVAIEVSAEMHNAFFCAGMPKAAAEKKAQLGVDRAVVGTVNAVVLFAHFSDEDLALPSWGKELFDTERPGSISHFYDDMSQGRFRLRGTVSSRRYAAAGVAASYLAEKEGDEGEYGRFAIEILRQADVDIDFSLYDNDGPDGQPNSGDDDGLVDAVFIATASTPRNFLVAGATGIAGLGLKSIFVTNDLGIDGRPLEIHSQMGSIQRGRNFAETAATICHEFAHHLGLPDLYNTDFLRSGLYDPHEDSAGIGNWGLMGWGTLGWNGDDGPTSFSAWSRKRLGWAHVISPLQLTQRVRIEPVGDRGEMYQVPLPNGEYFLLEYRTRAASFYDRNIPGEGLLIWHVTGQGAKARIDLECADGLWRDAGYPLGESMDSVDGGDNLDFWSRDVDFNALYAGNLGDASDLFDGIIFSAFTPISNPAATSGDGRWDVRIENLRRDAGGMQMDIAISPVVHVEAVDLIGEDADDILAAGELGKLVFDLYKADGEAPLRVELSSLDSLVEVVSSTALYQVDPISRLDAESGVRYRLQGEENSVRIAPDFTGSHRAQVQIDVLEERVDGRHLVWRDEVEVEAVAAHQRVTDLVIIDTLGNSDGAVQAGELLRVGLTLDVETPSLLRAVDLRLHSLDERALSLDSGVLSFRRPNRYDDRVVNAPEFLVLISAVDSIAFELVAENGFDVWRDTLWVRVNEGRDPSAPRVNSLDAWYGSDALQLRVARDDIVEGDRVENVRVFVYDRTGAMPLTQVDLLAVGGDFRGSWFAAWPGAEYWLQVEVMDAEGNEGRGPRVHVGLPVPGEVLVGRRHLKAVEERIGAVAYELSGRWMAVADGERVYLYDVAGEELLHVLVVGTHVEALAFAATGLLAIAGGDGTLSIWNVESGLLERSWFGHEGPVRVVAFAETGELVSGGKDARVRWWDIESGRALEMLQVPSAVSALALSANGQYVAAATRGAEVVLWSGRERTRRVLRGHARTVAALAFSPDGTWLASSAPGGSVWVWNLERQGAGRALSDSIEAAGDLAFSPDGKWLASAGGDGSVRLWDRLGFQLQHRLHAGSGVVSFAFSPVVEDLLVGTWSGAHVLQLPGAADLSVSSSAPFFYRPYPNPFNAEISLPFRLAEEEEISLVIYDILGREVRVIKAETLPAGYYYDPDRALRWDARNADGNRVGSGVYIGVLQVGKRSLSRKIVHIK